MKILCILILLLFTGCDNFGDMKSYGVTIKKKSSFFIVDDDKLKELTGSSYTGNDYALPQIGWLLEYEGKPYPTGIAIKAYACQNENNNNNNTIILGLFTKKENESIILINQNLLQKVNIIDNKQEVVNNLCLKPLHSNNINISKEKSVIKIGKEEIDKALEEFENL